MSRVSVDINGMSQAVQTLLNQYGDDAFNALEDVVKETVKDTVNYLNTAGEFQNRTGKYRKSWKSKVTTNSKGTTATIYNENGHLTHLLEFGHVIKGGKGRTVPKGTSRDFPHIAEAQKYAEEMVVEKMERRFR